MTTSNNGIVNMNFSTIEEDGAKTTEKKNNGNLLTVTIEEDTNTVKEDEKRFGEFKLTQRSCSVWSQSCPRCQDGRPYRRASSRPRLSADFGVGFVPILVESKITTNEKGETVEVAEAPILYKINDSPPIYLTVFFAFQQFLISVAGSIIAPLLVAEAACALNDSDMIRKLVASTLMMNGVSTLLQNTLGIRLPLFQGPSGSYVVPLIALNKMDTTRCDVSAFYPPGYNSTLHGNDDIYQDELISVRLREMMGPLIVAGGLHCIIGLTGLVGVMMRFIGPVTIVPTILLIGIYIVKPAMAYTEAHWGIAFLTWSVGMVLSLYLGHKPMPLPVWTRKKGFHVIKYPLHQVFAVLISILVGWLVSGIMTASGYFTDDVNNVQYKARTDARADGITDAPWFYFPYPGQFGSPMFSLSAMIGFLIATVTSILDSIGDYYATANICRVPPPPKHGVNRGIAMEGFSSMLSGCLGAGHATTTYGGNIGAIGMTKVASRQVFIVLSIIYIVIAVLAKVTALFIAIPYPVLGGCLITIIGVFVGVNLSNLQVIDLSSTRNLSIIGTGVFVGLLVPEWLAKNSKAINTGSSEFDQVLLMLLGNPNFFGCVVTCFLDNTVPGTDEERGIAAWNSPELQEKDESTKYLEGDEVYEPYCPEWLKRQKWLRFVPLFPKYDQKATVTTESDEKV